VSHVTHVNEPRLISMSHVTPQANSMGREKDADFITMEYVVYVCVHVCVCEDACVRACVYLRVFV